MNSRFPRSASRGSALLDWGVAADGTTARFGLIDAASVPMGLTISTELPDPAHHDATARCGRGAAAALRRRQPARRLSLSNWRLKASPDGARPILTLSTEDGSAMFFVLPPERLDEIAAAATGGTPAPLRPN